MTRRRWSQRLNPFAGMTHLEAGLTVGLVIVAALLAAVIAAAITGLCYVVRWLAS
jgi:hypothetical protein